MRPDENLSQSTTSSSKNHQYIDTAMSKKKKKNRKSNFISSDKGQRFFNFAYSIGAAIVIWGALFKILHLPGGNTLLSIGMGTEVLMFILTAFDRPPREYKWEQVFPKLDNDDSESDDGDPAVDAAEDIDAVGDDVPAGNTSGMSAGTFVTGGSSVFVAHHDARQSVPADGVASVPVADAVSQVPAPASDVASATQNYLEQLNGITAEMAQLRESTQALNHVSEVLLEAYRAITENSENITRSSTGYVEQMGDLSRNIQGLNTIYEIQLKSISSQLDAIDRVNRGIKDIRDMYEKSSEQSARYCEETEKMARYMQQLNAVYEKMITAMTINMYNPMMAPGQQTPDASTNS